MRSSLLALFFGSTALAGQIIFDGRFNDYTTATDFDIWQWSNQVGSWQTYIHGGTTMSTYLTLSSDYKNPADQGSLQGVQLRIDNSSHWEGQPMLRTELIPNRVGGSNSESGKEFYHFSIAITDDHPPNVTYEHQIIFFENHFAQFKYGTDSGQPFTEGESDYLRFYVGSNIAWSAAFTPGVWFNFAWEVDFTNSQVALWQSTGGQDLVQVVPPTSTSVSQSDFHIGVLRLPIDGSTQDPTAEYYLYSGIYIENGTLTTSVNTGQEGSSSSASSSQTTTTSKTSTSSQTSTTSKTSTTSSQTSTTTKTSTSSPTTTTTSKSSTHTTTTLTSTSTTSTTSTSATPTTSSGSTNCSQHWGQCGGQEWSGPTCCVSGTTCTFLNPWYSQCL